MSRNAVDELATLVAVLLRQHADPAAFRAAEPAVLALVNPVARLAVGRALQATRPPLAPPESEAPLGPVDPTALEVAVLEVLRQARQRGHPGAPGREGA